MAGITDLQYKLMEMQSKGYPEFDAGLYPYQELKFEDYYSPPKGPLYNIDPTLVPEGENYYSEDYDFDTDKTSYSQWTGVDDPYQRLNVELMPDTHALGTSHGALQTINPDLMESYGTFPSSARNELSPVPDWYPGPTTDLGYRKTVEELPGGGTITTSSRNEAVNQANINKYITDILSHEVGHGLSKQRGFKPILEEAKGIDVGYGPYKLSEFAMSELYNRALDIERQKMMYPNQEESDNFSDIWWGTSRSDLSKRYILKKLGSVDAMNNYLSQVKPLVNRYFDQVGKHKRYKKSYERGREPGHWYHGLDYKGGAAGDVSQAGPGRQEEPGGGAFLKSTPASGDQRGSMPTGTAGKNPWGRAHGGLIDIPLTGRSRYI